MNKEAFKDEDGGCGWYQYFDEVGREWRLEEGVGGCYKAYEDVGGAFAFCCHIYTNAKSLRLLHKCVEEALSNCDEDEFFDPLA